MCGTLFAALGHRRRSLTCVRNTDNLGGAGDVKTAFKTSSPLFAFRETHGREPFIHMNVLKLPGSLFNGNHTSKDIYKQQINSLPGC